MPSQLVNAVVSQFQICQFLSIVFQLQITINILKDDQQYSLCVDSKELHYSKIIIRQKHVYNNIEVMTFTGTSIFVR